jgi:hypothetical protein
MGVKSMSVPFIFRCPREMALDLEGLERQWFTARSQVIIRLLAQSLSDHGRVAELGRMKMAEERAVEALADYQDLAAKLQRERDDVQKALEKAQAELREARELSAKPQLGKVDPKAVAVARSAHLHADLEGLADRALWSQERRVEWAQKPHPAIPDELAQLRLKAGSWPEALRVAREAATALGVAW